MPFIPRTRFGQNWLAIFWIVLAVLASVAVTAYVIGVLLTAAYQVERLSETNGLIALDVHGTLWASLFVILLGFTIYWFLAIEMKASGLTSRDIVEKLGGTPIVRGTTLHEQRVINVAEEMAIACGRPMPGIYVMEREDGINAFTAGTTQWDTVIVITRGTMRRLKRAELQAVLAHEFGHIVNEDVLHNTVILRYLAALGPVAEWAKRARQSVLVFLVMALILAPLGFLFPAVAALAFMAALLALVMVPVAAITSVGYAGTLIVRAAHAAYARERELAADALSVQFTRNPLGLADVLRKIAGIPGGATLQSTHAMHVAHMCIAPALAGWVEGRFAVHPPIDERLRHIGCPLTAAERAKLDHYDPSILPRYLAEVDEEMRVMHLGGGSAGTGTGVEVEPDQPGSVALEQLLQAAPDPKLARDVLSSIATDLREALATPEGARAAAHALIGQTPGVAGDASALTLRFTQVLANRGAISRLPLLELAAPGLRSMSAGEREAFAKEVRAAIAADGKVTLRETVFAILLTDALTLEERHPWRRKPAVPNDDASSAFAVVLGTAVHAFCRTAEQAQSAFDDGLRETPYKATLPEKSQLSFPAFERALSRLRDLDPLKKPLVTRGVGIALARDGRITPSELEFVRAIGVALDCPIPPIAVTHPGDS